MPKAYSYLRFSNPEQGRGDSFRRQIEMARNYAALNDLELDENIQFHDYGVSAFHSRNARIGALKNFLIQIESGIIESGSYLLVESLDRITRDEILTALKIFLQIIQSGINIVTLIDEKTYSKEGVISNPTDLLISLLVMMRAREESETKSERCKAVWVNKREKIKNKEIFINFIPAWLKLNKSGDKFEIKRDKAKIIKLIFRKRSKEESARSITKYLNLKKIPTIGRLGYWTFIQVHQLLHNYAVIGTLKLYTRERKGDKIVKIPCGDILNYYPSVISSSLFNKVQENKKVYNNRHGVKPGGNIFHGIAKCSECGSPMVRQNSGHKYKYLRCSSAMQNIGCSSNHRIRFYSLERALIQNISFLIGSVPECDTKEIDKELSAISKKSDELNKIIECLSKYMSSGKISILNKMAEAENKLKDILKHQNELKQKKSIMSDSSIKLKLSYLRQCLNCQPLNVSSINNLLHQLFKVILINHNKSQISFNWIQGGITEIKYFPYLRLGENHNDKGLFISEILPS